MDLSSQTPAPAPASFTKVATPRRTPQQREEMAANLATQASETLHTASPRLISSLLRHCSTLSPSFRLKPFSSRMSSYFATDHRSEALSPRNLWQYTRSIQNEFASADMALDN